jgi:hypothetical protein
MAWQEVTTDVGAKVGLTKYSVALKHGGARISVPAAIIKALGWKNGATFKLMVGGGELSGKLRLEPAKDGKIVGRQPPNGGEGLIIRLGRWKGLAPRDVDVVSVEAEVEGSALVVTLPQHARNEAPPPRPTTSATTISSPPSAGAAPAKRDVSAQFFNDPKPQPAMASGVRGGRTS